MQRASGWGRLSRPSSQLPNPPSPRPLIRQADALSGTLEGLWRVPQRQEDGRSLLAWPSLARTRW